MGQKSRVRRRSRVRINHNYALESFIENVSRFGSAAASECLAAISECEELWELVDQAASLEREREEVFSRIGKLQAKILKPFEARAKKAGRL